jgi:hypothetical protein
MSSADATDCDLIFFPVSLKSESIFPESTMGILGRCSSSLVRSFNYCPKNLRPERTFPVMIFMSLRIYGGYCDNDYGVGAILSVESTSCFRCWFVLIFSWTDEFLVFLLSSYIPLALLLLLFGGVCGAVPNYYWGCLENSMSPPPRLPVGEESWVMGLLGPV